MIMNPISTIFYIWNRISYGLGLGLREEYENYKSVPDKFAHICSKSQKYSSCLPKKIEDEKGWIHEYFRNCPESEVEILHIRDIDSCGNYIFGGLLSRVYPNIKILIFDRYRGYSENIYDGHLLKNLEILILHGGQGVDWYWEFSRALPPVKWLFMEEDYDRQEAIIETSLDGIIFYHQDDDEYDRICLYPPPPRWVLETVPNFYLIYSRNKGWERRKELILYWLI
jgi:hypothetical protein